MEPKEITTAEVICVFQSQLAPARARHGDWIDKIIDTAMIEAINYFAGGKHSVTFQLSSGDRRRFQGNLWLSTPAERLAYYFVTEFKQRTDEGEPQWVEGTQVYDDNRWTAGVLTGMPRTA